MLAFALKSDGWLENLGGRLLMNSANIGCEFFLETLSSL